MSLSKKEAKVLKAFLLGMVISTVIIAVFVALGPLFKMHFVIGFPLLLIEQRGMVVEISWLLPVIVGLCFAIVEGLAMV